MPEQKRYIPDSIHELLHQGKGCIFPDIVPSFFCSCGPTLRAVDAAGAARGLGAI